MALNLFGTEVSGQSGKRQSGRGLYIPLGRRKGVNVSYSCRKELDTSTAWGRGMESMFLRGSVRNELLPLTTCEWDGRKLA